MNALQSDARRALYWLLPLGALVLLIGWQTDFGHAWTRPVPAELSVAPRPVDIAVLPEYRPAATPEANRDIVDRSLFNPTRRPAPVVVAEAAKSSMRRGQFTLAGTMVVDGKAVALLRETAGGKSRRVAQGESINEMTVAEVKSDRVRLTMGGESEELALKLAVGPKTTVQPVVATAPTPMSPQATAAAAAAAANAAAAQRAPAAGPQDVASILAERRRAARAAEVAAGTAPPGTPVAPVAQPAPVPPAAAAPAAPADPAWEAVYQRYRQPRR